MSIESYVPFSSAAPLSAVREDIYNIISPILDKLAYNDSIFLGDEGLGYYEASLTVVEDFLIDIPFCAGLQLVIGGGDLFIQIDTADHPLSPADQENRRKFDAFIKIDVAKLRFPKSWLTPMVLDNTDDYVPDENPNHFVEIAIPFGIRINQDLSIEPIWPNEEETPLSLPVAMLGTTGILLGFTNIFFDFSRKNNIAQATADDRANDFIGFFAEEAIIAFPKFWQKDLSKPSTAVIKGTNLLVGTGGVSGTIGMYTTNSGDLFHTTLGNLELSLDAFDLTLKKSSIIHSHIHGTLKVPGFKNSTGDDALINIDVNVLDKDNYSFTASEDIGIDAIQIPNVLKFIIKSLTIGESDGRHFISVSGNLGFIASGVASALPKDIEIKRLVIWDDGKIELQGGTVTLAKPISLKLGPAKLSITAIGFGSDERMGPGPSGTVVLRKYNYFEFAAGLSVKPGGVDARGDGIKFYYSVDGLAFDFFIRIESIKIDLIIPGSATEQSATLLIKGYLSMKPPAPPDTGSEYIGGVAFSMPKSGLGGSVAMRMNPEVPSFLLDVEVDLPSPIIIFAGVGIYGFRGLFGQRYLASREAPALAAAGLQPDGEWYQYYKLKVSPDYKEGIQVSKFARKQGFSIGLGASIATAGDGGKLFSSKVFFMVSLPGVFLLQGQAGILRERIKITDTTDPPFSLLLVITKESFTADFGVDYKLPEESGKILKLSALMEMAFFFKTPNAWYLNVGRDLPETKRVTGRIFDLFDVYSYLMFSGTGIKAGAGASFAQSYKAGPLSADLRVYLDIAGRINFKPVQIGASIAFGGSLALKAFKFRFQMTASLTLAGEVPHPFYISGELRACVRVLKKDRCITIAFKWVYDPIPNTTDIPLFAPEKAIKAKNILTQETYPLLLLEGLPLPANADAVTDAYTIPLDSTVDIEFLKPIRGTSGKPGIDMIGGATAVSNTDQVPPTPGSLPAVSHTFTLEGLAIKHWDPTSSTWKLFDIYEALSPLSIPGVNVKKPADPRYGYWQYDTATNKINRLSIMAMSPLEYTRAASKFIPSEYLGINSRDLFCPPQMKAKVCAAFNNIEGSIFKKNELNGQEGLMFRLIGADGSVQPITNPFGFNNALVLEPGSAMEIYFPEPTAMVELTMLMRTEGLSVSYYSEVFGPKKDSNLIPIKKHVLVKKETPSISKLMVPLEYQDDKKPISKIRIDAGLCSSTPVTCTNTNESADLQSLFNALAQTAKLTNTALPGTVGAVDLKQAPYAAIYNPRLATYKLSNTKHFYYTAPMPGAGAAVKAQYAVQVSSLSGGGTGMYQLIVNSKTIATAAWQGDSLSTATELMNSLNTGVSLGEVFHAVGQPQVWPFDGATGYTAIIGVPDAPHAGFGNALIVLAPAPGEMYNGNSPIISKKYHYAAHLTTLVQSPPAAGSATLSASIGAPDQNACTINLETSNGQSIFFGQITSFANVRPDPSFYVTGSNYHFLMEATLSSTTVTLKGTSTCYPIADCQGGSLSHNKEICIEVNNQITSLQNRVKELTIEKTIAEQICSVHMEGDCSAIGNIYCQRAVTLESEIIALNEQIATLSEYTSTQCSIVDSGSAGNGGEVFTNPCAAYIFRVCSMTSVNYAFNQTAPTSTQVATNASAMLEALSNSLQPIWRPNTIYGIELVTLDQKSMGVSVPVTNSFMFRTAGPVGHFHEKRPEYNALSDDNKDTFRLKSIKDYIDYEKSYPNANGNIISAKPLFYGCPKLLLFFISPQVYTMYNNFDAFNGLPAVTSSLQAVIKDPTEANNLPDQLTGDITWVINDTGILTQDVITLNNLMNGPVCTTVYQITHAKGANIEINLCGKLKPLKLYNAVYNAVYNTVSRGVHTYSFQTSQYADFKEQVESYLIKDENDVVKKYAFYDIDKAFNPGVVSPSPTGIELARLVIDGTEPQTTENGSLRDFAQPYDRLIDKAFELIALNPSVTTEFNMLVDTSTGNPTSGNVLGILIRNPEPFNDPKLKPVDLEKTIKVVTNSVGNVVDPNYKVIVSKDGSKAFITHKNSPTDLNIAAQNLYIRFQYLEFDGTAYTLNNAAINQVVVRVQVKAPLTSLISADCGRTNVALDEVLQANLITGAIDYEFKIEHTASNFSATYTRGNADGKLPLVEIEGLMYNRTYSVSVRPIISGRLTKFGPACTVSTKVLAFVIVQPANIVQGQSGLIRVEVQDINGNIIYEYQDDVTVVVNGDAVIANSGLVTIMNGVGTISITDDTVETVNLSLTDSENTGLTVTSTSQITFTVAPATQLVIEDPIDTVEGMQATVTVHARNSFPSEDIDTNFNGTVKLNLTGLATSTNGGIVTLVNGTGTIQITDTAPETVVLSLEDVGNTGLDVSSTQDIIFTVAAATLFLIADPSDSVQGIAVTVTVTARNQYGYIDTNYQNDVTLVSSGSATGAGLVSIVNGVGTLQINDTTVETVQLTLSDTESTGLNITSNQDVIFGIAPATKFVIIDPSDSVQGTAVTVTVQAQNQFDTIDTAYQTDVTLVTNGSATGAGLVSIVNGVGTLQINDTTVETVHLSLSDTQVTGLNVTSNQDVVFGIAPATKFVILDPADSIQGVATTVTVQAQNQFNTIDTAYQTDVTLVTNGSATGAGLVSIVNGVGTLQINDTTNETVHLTLNDTQSTGLNITSNQDVIFGIAPATKFVMLDPADSVQGTAVTVTVQAQNQFDTIDTAYQNDVTLVSNGSATGAGLINIVNGVGTLNINDTTVETVHLTLSDTQSTGLNVSSNQDVVFGIAPATKFVILDPADSVQGVAVTVTVQAQNNFNTIDTAYQSDVTLVTNGNATGAGLVNIVNGVGTIQINDTTPQTVQLTLSDTQSTGLNVTSNQDVVFGIAPATMFVVLDPTDSVQGVAVTVTVQAQNNFGTIDPTYQNDVTLVTNGSATGAGLVSIVNGIGTLQINDTTPQTVHLTLSDTQSTGLAVTSNQDVVFGIAPATMFVIIDPADSVQGVATTVTVQAQNNFGTIDTAYQNDVTLVTNGSATGGGLVNIVNGVGTLNINDTTVETVHLTLTDTQSTGLNITSNQDVVFGIAPATKFVIIDPADNIVGATITVTVQAQNNFGTIVTSYQNDVTLVTSGSATGGGVVDIVNGVGTKNITDAVAQTVTLTLTDSQSTGLNVTSTQNVIFATALIFNDTFNVGLFSNTVLSSHDPDLGLSWTQLINMGGSSGIKATGLSDRAAPVSSLGWDEGSFYGANVSGGYLLANYEVEAKSVATGSVTPIILGVRVSASGNDGYFVRFNTSTSQLYKRVGGTWTAVGSAAGGVANNATAKLQISGTTLKFFINGTLTITATVTDISATGVGGLGMGRLMISTDDETGIQADDFKVTLV